MARPRTPNKNRIYHPLYSVAYLERRYDRYYVVLKGKRTNTELDWKPENKTLALKILERIVLEYLNPTPEEDKQLKIQTIADALQLWAKIQKQRNKEDTYRKIRNAFNNLMPETGLLLSDTEAIRTTVLERLQVVPLVNNTKHKQLSWLRQFFSFCVEEGYCVRNPITKSLFPKQTPIDRDAFSDEEIEMIVAHFEAEQNGDRRQLILLVRFLQWSGMRINEALTIQWSDISEKRILIREGKGDRQREIPLSPFPELQKTIAALRVLNADSPKLFTWTTYAKLQYRMRMAIEHLGIEGKGRNFHCLRKWFENYLLNQMRMPAHITAQILGHTVAIQQKHYLKILNVNEMEETISNYTENIAKKG